MELDYHEKSAIEAGLNTGQAGNTIPGLLFCLWVKSNYFIPKLRKGTAPLVTEGNTPFHLVAILY